MDRWLWVKFRVKAENGDIGRALGNAFAQAGGWPQKDVNFDMRMAGSETTQDFRNGNNAVIVGNAQLHCAGKFGGAKA